MTKAEKTFECWYARYNHISPMMQEHAENFGEWLLKSDWQMDERNIWVKKSGNFVHGNVTEVKSTEELYKIFNNE